MFLENSLQCQSFIMHNPAEMNVIVKITYYMWKLVQRAVPISERRRENNILKLSLKKRKEKLTNSAVLIYIIIEFLRVLASFVTKRPIIINENFCKLFQIFKEHNAIPSFFVIQVDFNGKCFVTKLNFYTECLPCFRVKKPSYKILNYISVGINNRLEGEVLIVTNLCCPNE